MADQKNAGMISGFPPLAVLTGDELMEVSSLQRDGTWKTFSILVNKIRTNQGLSAYEVALKNGFQGTEEEWLESLHGQSAYQLAVALGFVGTETEWLETLVGPSAYQTAVDNGFVGTEEEFIESLKGKSAYQIAVANGYVGDEASWLESLHGKSAYDIAKELEPSIGTEQEWLTSLVGASAYQVAVNNGFVGTEAAWLASLEGKSAYAIWVAQGNSGTEADFIESLKGEPGQSAFELWQSQPGNENKTPADFLTSLKGTDGTNGESAYELWLEAGNTGTLDEFLDSLKGTDGINGTDGTNGEDGQSAYQIWESQAGNAGKTEAEFLASLKGSQGESAYDVAVNAGFVGTESEWLASLKGADGTNGTNGQSAYQLWVTQSGNAGKTEADFLKSLEGKSAYETYKALPGNSNKTEAEFIASLKGAEGERGMSAYEVWLDAGNTGSQATYLASLKGKDGTNGKDGAGLNVVATLSQEDFDQIVADGNSVPGEAYLVGDYMYIFNGTDWVKSNDLRGPEGKGLNYLGVWPTGTPLPLGAGYVAGDTYIWGATAGTQSLWTLSEKPTRQWVDVGVPGPQGKSAYQSWLDAGNTGSEAVFVESLKGKSAYQSWLAQPGNAGKSEAEFVAALKGADGTDGESAYEVWLSAGNSGTVNDYIASLKGLTGDQGESAYEVWLSLPGNEGKTEADFFTAITGPRGLQGQAAVAFTIEGQLSDASELPRPGEATKAYYVGKNLYVWIDSLGDYENLGSLNGESAYQLWLVQPGNAGKTEQEFLQSLIGKSAYQIAVDEGYVGDEASWVASLKGTDGKNLQVEGTKADADEIQAIVSPATQEAWVANDTGHLWIYNGVSWIDAGPFRGADGADGKSAYQLWEEQAGNVGKTEEEFLESLKGADGTDGTNGTNGQSAYQIWESQAGNTGKTEAEFLASLKGADGTNGTNGTNGRNVEVKGSLANLAAIQALPSPAAQDAYTAQDTNSLYMYISGVWTFLGKFQGEKGEEGAEGKQGPAGQGLNIIAEVDTLADLSQYDGSPSGSAVFVLEDHKLYQMNEAGTWNVGILIQGPQGEQGNDGPQGPAGTSITIMGSYANVSNLQAAHPTGNPGEGYLIGDDLYLYGVDPSNPAGDVWYNAGPVRGPQGLQGKEGPRGLRGLTGLQGERGSLWINLAPGVEIPSADTGREGDWAVSTTFVTFYKSATGWNEIGRLVAGDVNSPSAALGKVVREGTNWVPLPVDAVPNPVDGKQYVMKGNSTGGTTWAEITIPASGIADVPGGTVEPQGRTSAGWTAVMAKPTGQTTGRRYELLNGAWTLSGVQAASPTTLSTPLCYSQKADGTGEWVAVSFDMYSLKQDLAARTTSFTPDLAVQQTFRLNASSAITVTLPKYTDARTLMAVFVIEGNTNKVAFVAGSNANIGFNNGTAAADIEYGAAQTVITAFWNGFGTWIVSKGPSF